MYAWEQIQLTIDYMENHLSEEIQIEELAKMASLSVFYYQRLFKRLVKKTVAEYVKLRRMAKATEILLQKDKKILEIALELGFSSHEHFSRTFKETFGMTPADYRRNPVVLNRMTKPEFLLHYAVIDEGVPLITEGIVLEIKREQQTENISFTGLQKEISLSYLEGLGTNSGPDPLDILWKNFHEQKHAIEGIAQDSEEAGVTYSGSKPGYFSYFAGAKSSQAETPEGYVKWKLTRGDYIVCSFEAENFEALVMDVLYKAEQYMYQIWIPKHGLQTEAFCVERYASHTTETKTMELWLKVVH